MTEERFSAISAYALEMGAQGELSSERSLPPYGEKGVQMRAATQVFL